MIRLEGTNAEQGLKLLDESGLALETASDLTDGRTKRSWRQPLEHLWTQRRRGAQSTQRFRKG